MWQEIKEKKGLAIVEDCEDVAQQGFKEYTNGKVDYSRQ